MGARRDDITSSQRMQIAIRVLSPDRPWSTVSRLAEEYAVSRKTIYDISATGERVLMAGLEPGPRPSASRENGLGGSQAAGTEHGGADRGRSQPARRFVLPG